MPPLSIVQKDPANPSPGPSAPPQWLVSLLVVSLTVAIGVSAWNFKDLKYEVKTHIEWDRMETEDYHLFKQRTEDNIKMMQKEIIAAQQDRMAQTELLKKIARKQGIYIKEE